MSGAAGGAAQAQDLVAVLRSYLERMLGGVAGMKALLLDADTTRVVSTVFSQSEILEQEVYLVERLDEGRGDQLFHLKARPAGCCRRAVLGARLCWIGWAAPHRWSGAAGAA